MQLLELITGTSHHDQRGVLQAFSGFNLKDIVRMYAIEPADTQIIRAWQGHHKERKWFFPTAGSFEVQTIPLGEHTLPQLNPRSNWVLTASQPAVLAIPGGYLNGFKVLEEKSRLLVFSDFDLEASKADDIRFSLEEIPWIEHG
jgi:dTDP-4-dehydrorhamnose 3,5-epimerase-like enzyme